MITIIMAPMTTVTLMFWPQYEVSILFTRVQLLTAVQAILTACRLGLIIHLKTADSIVELPYQLPSCQRTVKNVLICSKCVNTK